MKQGSNIGIGLVIGVDHGFQQFLSYIMTIWLNGWGNPGYI